MWKLEFWTEVRQTTEVFDRFLEAQSRGAEDAVRILDQLHLRYFTPSELLKIFRFEEPESNQEFLWPPNISLKSQYRLIGNSVNVEVSERSMRQEKFGDFLYRSCGALLIIFLMVMNLRRDSPLFLFCSTCLIAAWFHLSLTRLEPRVH